MAFEMGCFSFIGKIVTRIHNLWLGGCEIGSMDDNAVEERDRLSELPDSLIHHILSLLPMRDVVSTTLLSKHWNNVWTTATCLNLCCEVTKDEKIQNFFNGALIFWKGPKIQKFGIHVHDHFEMSLAVDVDLWVRFAVANKVEDLNISLFYEKDFINFREDIYWAPHSLTSCSSIRHLRLGGCNLRIHESPSWNQLRSLTIMTFLLDEGLINRILLGCPKLEVFELHFLEINEELNVHFTSLKVVKMDKDSLVHSPDTVLRMCRSNVETFDNSGDLCCDCSLLTNVSPQTELTLGFCNQDYNGSRWNESLGEALSQIFSTIHHLEKVTFSRSSWCDEVLDALQKIYLPSLPKVKFLKLKDVHITQLGNRMEFEPEEQVCRVCGK